MYQHDPVILRTEIIFCVLSHVLAHKLFVYTVQTIIIILLPIKHDYIPHRRTIASTMIDSSPGRGRGSRYDGMCCEIKIY